jgi:hypothetical protein
MVVLMMIPLAAIIGGITSGIVKTLGRQRLAEQAQRERIVALERGLDPEKLPPLILPGDSGGNGLTFEQRQIRRSQALSIWGLVTVAVGVGMLGMGIMVGPRMEEGAVGFVPIAVGTALLIGSRIGRPSAEEVRKSAEPRR